MEKRVRLTKRLNKRQAAEYDDFGTINQEDRKFVDNDAYDKTPEEINHPLPDTRKEWQEDDDKRNELNMTVAKRSGRIATLWRIANKSTRLASHFLGAEAPTEMIEEQALEFAALGEEAIDSALARYDEVQAAAEDETAVAEETTETAETCPECDSDPCVCTAEETTETTETTEEVKEETAPVTEEVKEETVETAEEEVETAEETTEVAEEEVETAEDMVDETAEDDNVAVEEDEFEMDLDEEANPLDDALTAEDSNVDEDLVNLFNDKVEDEPVVARRQASKKKGVQTFAQPRVATAGKKGVSLENLWKSDPDVKDFFK